jgi:hypothetical protein
MNFYGYGLLMEKVLRAAGPNLNRTTLGAAFDTLQNYNNDIQPPLSWKLGQSLGTEALYPAVCCHSDFTWRGLGPAGSFE